MSLDPDNIVGSQPADSPVQHASNSTYLGTGAAQFSHAAPGRIGVLLCNLGTPSAPTAGAVRRYLAEFLSDPRLIELPRWLWLPILHGVILNLRPRRSARAYAKVWTADGSPLLTFSRAQEAAVRATLGAEFGDRITVALGMRYGTPAIREGLERLRLAGARRVLVLPLYPQYSGPATGSVFDAVAQSLSRWRWVPDLRFISSYHAEPAYVDALAASIRAHWAAAGRAERLFFSFHGLPHRYLMQGDPYFCHCQATARLVAERLGLGKDEWQVVFQSRFGRERWLEPYADVTLIEAARRGLREVEVICPGFAADCLETLEEMAIVNRAAFIAAGGTDLRYIPALNAAPAHIEALCGLVRRNLAGWPEAAAQATDPSTAEARQTRARDLGAPA